MSSGWRMDATMVGPNSPFTCTLMVVEGRSAANFAVTGLEMIGKEQFGVLPVQGKLANCFSLSVDQVKKNDMLMKIVNAFGLKFGKIFSTLDDLKMLRYQKMLIMMDPDNEGHHNKLLMINFVHRFWPSLIALGFLEVFTTPSYSMSKNGTSFFFNDGLALESWKKENEDWHLYEEKYHKSLGTFTPAQASIIFSDMASRISVVKDESSNDEYLRLAFENFKKDNGSQLNRRRQLVSSAMVEASNRRKEGLPLYVKRADQSSIEQMVKTDFAQFCLTETENAIPQLTDGFKLSQRLILYACLKHKEEKPVKVTQLVGQVSELLGEYSSNEKFLMATMIDMAERFIGGNNVNLLEAHGMYGSRLSNGKDAATAHYLSTKVASIARKIFRIEDDPLLRYREVDGRKLAIPESYQPIIPFVLVNGSTQISTPWTTEIPACNPRTLALNILQKNQNFEYMTPIEPYSKDFKGSITRIDGGFTTTGIIQELSSTSFAVTELPIGLSVEEFRSTLEQHRENGSIIDFHQSGDHTNVRFDISLTEESLRAAKKPGLTAAFNLVSSLSTRSMYALDQNMIVQKFESLDDIFNAWYRNRLQIYNERIEFLKNLYPKEAELMENQIRYAESDFHRSISTEDALIRKLSELGFSSDPVKEYTKSRTGEQSETKDFDYLLNLTSRQMVKSNVDKLRATLEEKRKEIAFLEQTTAKQLWSKEVREFLVALDEHEGLTPPELPTNVHTADVLMLDASPRYDLNNEAEVVSASESQALNDDWDNEMLMDNPYDDFNEAPYNEQSQSLSQEELPVLADLRELPLEANGGDNMIGGQPPKKKYVRNKEKDKLTRKARTSKREYKDNVNAKRKVDIDNMSEEEKAAYYRKRRESTNASRAKIKK